MANVIRYFSTTSAGTGDGTTWANRAALFVSGNWSTVITGFNFTSDSLEAFIGPGNYTQSQSLTGAIFTTAPTAVNPCWLVACDSSGNRWVPDWSWKSAQPMDVLSMPFIGSSSITLINHGAIHLFGLNLQGSINTNVVANAASVNFCCITNAGSGTAAVACAAPAANSVLRCTGTTFNTVFNAVGTNCRIEGNMAATSGNRRGLNTSTAATLFYDSCTFINCIGGGIFNSGTARLLLSRCNFINCGIAIQYTSTTELGTIVSHCLIENCTTGISNASGNLIASRNRLRDNGTNFSLGVHSKEYGSILTPATDAEEFVNAAAGDYRIKNTAAIWGLGIGAGDEPAAPSGGATLPPIVYGGGLLI
jgi:hypothetical protein